MLKLLLSGLFFAQTSTVSVPPALEEWVPWVLDQTSVNCPDRGIAEGEQGRQCVLPGTLRLSVSADGARFSQRARRFTLGPIVLPGSRDSAWPMAVTVNGVAVPVLGDSGSPSIFLNGEAQIEGSFVWSKAPERLRVPANMPLVFSKDGALIAAPEREGDELWLGRAQSTERAADALDVQVHRLLSDGLPMRLDTDIALRVSGEAREVTLGPALLPGFAPLALGGDLNAKLNPDGSLSVQLRPGEWHLSLNARALMPLTGLQLAAAVGDWPAEESLSFQADASLRTVQLDGLASVDPKQANVPDAWQRFPAYIFTPDAKLNIGIDSRGRDADAPNRLRLTRELWLDFAGKSYSTKDQLSGEMVRDWRVGMRAPYTMTRAQSPNANGGLEPLLVTKNAQGTGVEVRSNNLSLIAASRIAATGAMPATGYDGTIESAQLTLNTPPGWTLIAASGATEAPSAWWDKWNVFTAFSVALCALAGWRLGGWRLGVAVLAYAVISAFENSAPLFWLLALLLLGLLARQINAQRWQLALRVIGLFALAILLLQSLGFVERQARLALHPQLEFDAIGVGSSPSNSNSDVAGFGAVMNQMSVPMAMEAPESSMDAAASAQEVPPPPPPPPMKLSEQSSAYNDRSPISSRGGMDQKINIMRKQMNRYAANSVVQAGAAEPNWRWNSHGLKIAGPITPDQQLHIVLLPPWLTSLLRILASALLLYALWCVAFAGPKNAAGKSLGWWRSWSSESKSKADSRIDVPASGPAGASASAAVATLLLVTALTLLPNAALHAQNTPRAELLEELKVRLTRAPQCAPNCVSLPSAQVQIQGDNFSMRVLAHIGVRSVVSLPSGERSLADVRITVDGVPAEFSQRSEGTGQLLLEAGVHVIGLDGTARADRITLDFPTVPNRVQTQSSGWEAGGVRDEKLTSGTLDLVRSQQVNLKDTGGKTSAQFPPYVRVLRQLRFDLEWRVETTVQRLTNAESGFTVRVPLLPGERPLGASVQIVDGVALVPMQANENEVQFSAALDLIPELKLTAPAQADRVEVWTLESSPIWHVDFAGVPLSLTPLGQGVDDLQLRFDPLPEEVLSLKLTRPDAAPGPAFRIDDVSVSSRPGERARDTQLSFVLAATQGGRHGIRLPAEAELINVSKNGTALTLRLKESNLELPVEPGENRYEINFREVQVIGPKLAIPAIDLMLPSANIRLGLELPRTRWLIWAFGPTLGPAVLYWATLIVVLLLAAGLAKSGRTALGFGAWALLGLGLTGFGWQAFIVVAVWFLLLQWRMQNGANLRDWPHRLLQVALLGLTAAALLCIIGGAFNGLLDRLNMQVIGNGSSADSLRWFADQSSGALPSAGAWTLPSWLYKALMLAWALWLAFALLRWLRYAWLAFSTGGIWRAFPKTMRPVIVLPPIPGKPAPASAINNPAHAQLNIALHIAASEDQATLIELGKNCLRASEAKNFSEAGLQRHLAALFAPEKVQAELTDRNIEYWLAEVAGSPLGLLKLVHGKAAPYQKITPASQIEHLVFLAQAQGLGLGTRLMQAAVEQAKRAGSDELWVMLASHDSETQAVYAQFGFSEQLSLPYATDKGEIGVKIWGKSLVA
jgi:GNAT superfamily N-acetyltransferase